MTVCGLAHVLCMPSRAGPRWRYPADSPARDVAGFRKTLQYGRDCQTAYVRHGEKRVDPEERASALLELLSRRNTPTPVSELAAALRVSERTINYDLDALRRRGTVLKSIPGRNGGILLEQRRSADPQPGAAGREPQDRFVGYERELDLLVSALPGNAQSGRVALISGDAGIGKTRLCEELAARAGEMGVGIIWGRCVDNEGAPPLWPWAQILRSLASSDSADTVLQDAQADAARIARSRDSNLGFVITVYAEPGLFYQLSVTRQRSGLSFITSPVGDLEFVHPSPATANVLTFLVAGPQAHRDETFQGEMKRYRNRFRTVGRYPYRASDLVLLNEYHPRQLADPSDPPQYELQMYLLKQAP